MKSSQFFSIVHWVLSGLLSVLSSGVLAQEASASPVAAPAARAATKSAASARVPRDVERASAGGRAPAAKVQGATSKRERRAAGAAKASASQGSREQTPNSRRSEPPSGPESSTPLLPPLAAEERAALISALMQERLYWRSRETGLAAPVLATVAGVVGTAVGAALVVGGNDDGHNRGMVNAGIGTSITGVVSFITGIALFCYRTANSTQAEEIRKIDRKLDTLGIPARVMPWLSTGAHASAGLTLKMSL